MIEKIFPVHAGPKVLPVDIEDVFYGLFQY